MMNFPNYRVTDIARHAENYQAGNYHYVVELWHGQRPDAGPPALDLGTGRVLYDTNGDNPIGIAEREERQLEALRFATQQNSAAFASHVAGRSFTRYEIPGWYVTVFDEDAYRLASIAGCPRPKVQKFPGVLIRHADPQFILWNDKITTAHGLAIPFGGELGDDAIGLITAVVNAEIGAVNLPGGRMALADVARIKVGGDVLTGPYPGIPAQERVTSCAVTWRDGHESTIYIHTAGQSPGYSFTFNIYDNLVDAAAAFGDEPRANWPKGSPLI